MSSEIDEIDVLCGISPCLQYLLMSWHGCYSNGRFDIYVHKQAQCRLPSGRSRYKNKVTVRPIVAGAIKTIFLENKTRPVGDKRHNGPSGSEIPQGSASCPPSKTPMPHSNIQFPIYSLCWPQVYIMPHSMSLDYVTLTLVQRHSSHNGRHDNAILNGFDCRTSRCQ